MEGEWSQTTLGAIATKDGYGLVDGPFGSNLPASSYTESGVPVIRGSNLTLGKSRFVADEFVFVSRETANRLARSLCRPLDIIFTKKGTLGQTGLVPSDARCDQYLLSSNQMKLTVDRRLADPLYVYYFVSSPESTEKIVRDSEATGVPKTNVAYLRGFPIALPPLSEQRAISHILGTLDDKIGLNRRMSETLEAMARALFKSWFVDFEPVRAKMEGRWRRGESLPGLPAHLYDLFPDRLVDSELGEIPAGWEVTALAEHFEAVKGVSYKGSGLCDDGVPLHNLNSVLEGGGYKYEGIKHYSGEYAERHVVRPGDVIVANTEQGHHRLLIGYAAIVPRLFGDYGIASHHMYRLRRRADSWLTSSYLYLLLNSREMHDIVSGYANGTTVNMLPIDGVQRPLMVCPPAGLVEVFNALAVESERSREEMVSESRTLIALRDTLLPKLVSGELRIPQSLLGGTRSGAFQR